MRILAGRGRKATLVLIVGGLITGLCLAPPTAAARGTADIAVTLTATPSPVVSGNVVTYVVTVANHGPSTAGNVQVLMPVLPGAVFTGIATSTGSCATPTSGTTGNIFCSLGQLPAAAGQNQASIRVREQVRVLSGVTREEVKIHTAANDPNTANNLARLVTPVSPRNADLSIQMDAPTQVAVGGTVTYTLTAHNAGPNASLGTVVTDRVPNGTAFQSVTTTQGRCATPAVGGAGVVRCLLGRFASVSPNTATVTVTVKEIATGGIIRNLANIAAANTNDPDHSNNFASASTTLVNGIVLPPPATTDLGVRVTAAPPEVQPGDDLTFVLAVANGGPDTATAVSLSSAVPDGSTFVSATPTQGTCAGPAVGQGGTVNCVIGNLGVRGYATVNLIVHVTANYGTRIQDTVTAIHGLNEVDPTPLDEAATMSIPVADGTTVVVLTLPTADISIDQIVTNSADNVDHVTHSFTITNNGPAVPSDVKFTVDFAPGVTASLAQSVINKGSCTQSTTSAGTTFSCDIGSMNVGTVAGLTVPTDVNEGMLLSDPPTVSVSEAAQSYGFGDLSPGFEKTLNQPSMVSAVTGTITSVSGAVDPNDTNNKTFTIVEPKPLQILASYSSGHCKNKDLGRFAALLQIDCDSPVDVVTTWATTVAALGAAGIGNGVLASIVYYTIEVVAVAAENGVIIRG